MHAEDYSERSVRNDEEVFIMKVLHVNTHMNIGGIGNYILNLTSSMKKKGIDSIVASSGGGLEAELAGLSIKHERIGLDTKFEFAPRVIISGFRLAGIVKREGVDIIHAHSRVSQVASSIASCITGVPYVTTCHGYFKKRLRKVFDTWGSKVIAISDAVKIHLIKDLGVREDRIALIYSGIDISRFSKSYTEAELRVLKDKLMLRSGPIIGTIGRLSPVKGQRFLIEAMKYIVKERPDVELLIVGDGEEKTALEKLASSFGLEKTVHFAKADLDTPKFLSVMDVFVFPSLKEGLGIALLEALASGRACVASDAGGIGDIVKDGLSGILVRPMSAHDIGEAVIKLLSDEDLRRMLSEAGCAMVKERFTLDLMRDNILDLYKKVLNSP